MIDTFSLSKTLGHKLSFESFDLPFGVPLCLKHPFTINSFRPLGLFDEIPNFINSNGF